MTTNIRKWGNSHAVRLPQPILDKVNFKGNDAIDIIAEDDRIIIQKTAKKTTLKDRIEEFYGTDFETAIKNNPYEFEEVDWGAPVGKEVW